MLARCAIAIACAVVALGIAGAAGGDDWIGDLYGWEAPRGVVRVTTDGGRHWRPLPLWEVGDLWTYAHTGPTTGIVSLGDPRGIETAWTIDNGRRWYDAPHIQPFQPAIEGHGSYLFWAPAPFLGGRPRPGRLYQVKPWPPRKAQLECRRGFMRALEGTLRCVFPTNPVRSKLVATLPRAQIEQLQSAPGGIVALISPLTPDREPITPLRVLIRRNDRNTLFTLPRLPAEREAGLTSADLSVRWPSITVVGEARLPDGVTIKLRAIWTSHNGGRTWSVTEAG